MFRRLIFVGWQLSSIMVMLIVCNRLLAQSSKAGDLVDFANEIRPILAVHCYSCHGPDANSRAADLRLDIRDEALAKPAFVPYEPSKSALVDRILSDDHDYQMPPPANKKPLTEKQKDLLRKWIEQGAVYASHWAFTAPTMPAIPTLSTTNWASNPIDCFVGKRLEQEELIPAPKADRATLLRRVSLDLTGLPPTVAELQHFLADSSEGAYERVVDRLLASKHYAEKMAMEWLDLARYADTNGYNNDEDRTMWPWRDWVINAFDSNMPFDQFTIEQLAGDLLPDATQDQLIATGFLRNQGHNTEGGIIQEEYRVEYVADRVHTVSTVFLGLSMQCARCHDHKFDPISQKEYYQFYSFFNSLDEKQAGYSKFVGAEPFIRVPTVEQASKVRALDEQIAALQTRSKQLEDQSDANVAELVAETSIDELKSRYAHKPLVRFPLDRTEGDTLFESISETKVGKTTGMLAWPAGKLHEAVELFDGSRIEVGEVAQFAYDRPFSISVWIKPNSNDGMAILSKMDESQSFRGYDLLLSAGKIEMHLVHRWPDNAIKISTKQLITPKQWHHVVVSYDGSKAAAGIRVFVDSKLHPHDTVQDSLRDPIDTRQPFRIGLRQQSLPFQGLVDELQLFESALEEGNVTQLAAFEPVSSFADWVRLPVNERSDTQHQQIRQFYLNRIEAEYPSLQKKIAEATKEKAAVEEAYPAVMILREMNPPRETFVLKRGQYDQPTDKVVSKVPAAILKSDIETPQDRITLARWIVSDANPLTARVTVNRWWQNFFGTGIVKTVEDFGLTGDAPSNSQLLDYLACTLMERGWNVKALQKLIVMSSTYQQESRILPEMYNRDPENRLLARGPRNRLSAETIRDNALLISGLLQPRVGGPSVKPYQPSGLWEDVTVERRGKYVADVGEGLYRRSLYTFWKRTCPPPSMMSFDAPNREVCLARRGRTNTPLQSLVLLNDPIYVECARLLAQHMIREGGDNSNDRIDAGMNRAISRRAVDAERKLLTDLLEAAKRKFSSNPAGAQGLITIGATLPDSSLDPVELASWTIVASTLLNLDETISKR